MDTVRLINRVDELISLGSNILNTAMPAGDGAPYDYIVDQADLAGFRTTSLSFIQKLMGADSIYYQEFNKRVMGHGDDAARSGMSILKGVRGEIEGGWLAGMSALISAEIFSDFLEMAEHLLSEGYKDAAAVMIGSVLEDHMRRLAPKFSVDSMQINKLGEASPKKSNLLNDDLMKGGAYNGLTQKSVLGWLALRNDAAHGHYSKYDAKQVKNMHSGVLHFIQVNPT